MKERPDALGVELALTSVEDVDKALHEMSWLTLEQRRIEDPSKARIQAEMASTQAKLVVEVAGKPMTIKERWEALSTAILSWAKKGLAPVLPPNKKSLALSHGVIKTRDLAAAVEMLQGAKADVAAAAIAKEAGVLKGLEPLLEAKVHGVAVGRLISIKVELDKAAIKAVWDEKEKPELVGFLKSLSISVSAGKTQISIEPADLQVTTPGE